MPRQFRVLLIRHTSTAVSPQFWPLHPLVLVVFKVAPLRHPCRVASQSHLRMWLPCPVRTSHLAQVAQVRLPLWRIHQTQTLRGSHRSDSRPKGSMPRLHSVAMWLLRRRRHPLTHIRMVLLRHLLVQAFRRHHNPVTLPCHLLVLTVPEHHLRNNNHLQFIHRRSLLGRLVFPLPQGVPRILEANTLPRPRPVLPPKGLLPLSTVSCVRFSINNMKLRNVHSSW